MSMRDGEIGASPRPPEESFAMIGQENKPDDSVPGWHRDLGLLDGDLSLDQESQWRGSRMSNEASPKRSRHHSSLVQSLEDCQLINHRKPRPMMNSLCSNFELNQWRAPIE